MPIDSTLFLRPCWSGAKPLQRSGWVLEIQIRPDFVRGLVEDYVESPPVVCDLIGDEPVLALTSGQLIDIVVVKHGLRDAIIGDKALANCQSCTVFDVCEPRGIAVVTRPFLHDCQKCSVICII